MATINLDDSFEIDPSKPAYLVHLTMLAKAKEGSQRVHQRIRVDQDSSSPLEAFGDAVVATMNGETTQQTLAGGSCITLNFQQSPLQAEQAEPLTNGAQSIVDYFKLEVGKAYRLRSSHSITTILFAVAVSEIKRSDEWCVVLKDGPAYSIESPRVFAENYELIN